MPAKKNAIPRQSKAHKTVTDENGVTYVLHGFGAGNFRNLGIDPRVDFTKPVWEQVQRLARKDKQKLSKASTAA